MSNLLEVAFAGELVPGADAAQVRANLARLFQADPQRIAALFSGRRIVIKSNLDAESAEKYRLTLERAGARVEVSPVGPVEVVAPVAVAPAVAVPPPAVVAPAEPVTTPTPPGAFAALKVAPRDEYMAAFRDVAAPDFGLAPVGADLQDQRPAPVAPALDLSQLSVAPVGSDMGQAKAPPAAPPPDTSYLQLLD
ncbi:hypothetical protein SAMN05216229_11225 [Geopseudomonas sagittaria]|uniref:Uncharacterized protein n=1 Tax=Geopseudomonas sagittaria TaxID=1135990 RepID=A0A1I5W0H1_9GAMM|nr:hypothetical protein [Pseudomonas sagittaria]MCM2330143.1 hypothetical protein [Pseudomonas sagittaria]SFQ13181.1 hypothetical protein SAMN05216229_11225 [Pseudomonas sagittaria]